MTSLLRSFEIIRFAPGDATPCTGDALGMPVSLSVGRLGVGGGERELKTGAVIHMYIYIYRHCNIYMYIILVYMYIYIYNCTPTHSFVHFLGIGRGGPLEGRLDVELLCLLVSEVPSPGGPCTPITV